jgi:DNA-binding NtrC family response regulator
MAEQIRLLVVDDDRAMREMLCMLFREHGYDVAESDSVDKGIELASTSEFDVVLSSVRMPNRNGLELVGEMRRLCPHMPVVLMTAFGSMDSAVEALRAGAQDYITKPFESEAVLLIIERVLERRALEEENRRLRRAVDQTTSLGELIGASPAMREIFAVVRKLAHNRSNILITGESGTGKEMLARAIHFHGDRADKPFIPVSCAALPEELLESELFGHVRSGAASAHSSKRGLFEEARDGTIFLDEIGDMSLGLQSKLLRVIQDRKIKPVGGTRTTKVNMRILSATDKDLAKESAEGRFRSDLFHRLNVIPLHLPPLRERREDIAPLAEAFLRKHASASGRTFSREAMDLICARPWWGNARELENLVERTLTLSDSMEIGPDELPLGDGEATMVEDSADLMIRMAAQQRLSLRELEDRYLDEVLAMTGGNKVQAAKILCIDRKTLYRRQERNQHARAAS